MGQDLTATRDDGTLAGHRNTGRRLLPVVLCTLMLGLIMILRYARGLPMLNDADDFLRLHQIRVFLQTGNIFDRMLPGILQPEPYITHWPWIIDLPYAAVAWLVMPFSDLEAGLSVASFTVPLLLLMPALYFYNQLMLAAGFRMSVTALLVATIVAVPAFLEFTPGRIDYHNLEVTTFFAALALVLLLGRASAIASGALVGLSIAISLEFVLFNALIVGVVVFDFIFARKHGEERIKAFGGALAITALLLFVAIVPPPAYTADRCDTYSAPYALALALAGLSFMALPSLTSRRGGPLVRPGVLIALALASVTVVAVLFPKCLGGPYAGMDPYLRTLFLGGILQEMSFFQRPDLFTSDSLSDMTILFVGALAPAAFCLAARRYDRGLVVFALASLIALVQAVAYSRYLRYVPLFSGVGLVFVVVSLLPPRIASRIFAGGLPQTTLRRVLPIIPGLVLACALALFHFTAKTAPLPTTALDLAGSCDPSPSIDRYGWPEGAIVLSAPIIGVELLAQAKGPSVLATPHHPAAKGVERVHRFFDPGTSDPRAVLDETNATLVAVCKATAGSDATSRYALASALMEGQPPTWLTQCPSYEDMPLRFYRSTESPDAICPSVASPAG